MVHVEVRFVRESGKFIYIHTRIRPDMKAQTAFLVQILQNINFMGSHVQLLYVNVHMYRLQKERDDINNRCISKVILRYNKHFDVFFSQILHMHCCGHKILFIITNFTRDIVVILHDRLDC